MLPELVELARRRHALQKMADDAPAATRTNEPEDRGFVPGEDCPSCGASMERSADGKCNRCGEDWPLETPEPLESKQQGDEDLPQGFEADLSETPLPAKVAERAVIDATALSPEPDGGRSIERQISDWSADRQRGLVTSQLYNNAFKLGIGGLGAGMALRGLQGLVGTARRRRRTPGESTTTIGIKAAEAPPSPRTIRLTSAQIPKNVPDQVTSPLSYSLGGYGATSPLNHPLGIPLMGAATVGGLGLGYKAIDSLMRRHRKSELDRDTARQKARYEAAMAKVSGALDQLYDTLQTPEGRQKVAALVRTTGVTNAESALRDQKSAEVGNVGIPVLSPMLESVGLPGSISPQTAGVGAGALLGLGGLGALWAHQKAYDYSRKRQPSYVLRKAKDELARQEFERAPAVPVSLQDQDDK